MRLLYVVGLTVPNLLEIITMIAEIGRRLIVKLLLCLIPLFSCLFYCCCCCIIWNWDLELVRFIAYSISIKTLELFLNWVSKVAKLVCNSSQTSLSWPTNETYFINESTVRWNFQLWGFGPSHIGALKSSMSLVGKWWKRILFMLINIYVSIYWAQSFSIFELNKCYQPWEHER